MAVLAWWYNNRDPRKDSNVARKPPLLKYNRIRQDILIDGCGSWCDDCIAKDICEGCNQCAFEKCKSQCCECSVRCWRRQDIDSWLQDVNGLEITSLSCPTVFSQPDLPEYIPQVIHSAFGIEHPAYIINIQRVLHINTLNWSYQKRGVKQHYNIPPESKLILTFCAKDILLEQIWTHSNNWNGSESFWDGVASYAGHAAINAKGIRDIDASMSIEYSCFADAPRMDHVINIKRNIISAHELSKRGVPIILDAIVRTDMDLDRILTWGREQNVSWYLLNFQRTKAVSWVTKLISHRIERILAKGGKAIVSGIANPSMIKELIGRYRGHIAFTNTVVSMKTNYYRELNQGHWQQSRLTGKELFQHNLYQYCKATGLKIDQ